MNRLLPSLLLLACGDAGAQAIGGGAVGGGVVGDGSIGGGQDQVGPVFDFYPESGDGPGQLSSTLSAFGSMSLILSCAGEDVSGTTLTCDTGGAAPEAGSGTSPTSALAVPFYATAPRAVQGVAAGKFYEASSTTAADVTTSDLAVEAVFFASWDATGSDVIVAKQDDGGTGNGWSLAMTSATALTMTVDAGAAAQTASCTVQANTWQHAICFVDRNSATGMRCACNGTLGTATDPTGAAGTLTTTDPFRVLANVTAGTQYQGRVALVRAWSGSGLATGSYQAEASERLYRLTGTYASVGGAPVTYTRASVSVVDIDRDGDGVRRLFFVGNNWPRGSRYTEQTGGEYQAGVMIEQSSTNLALQSQTFGTSWTLLDAGDNYDGNMADAPDDTQTADKLRCPVNAASRVCGWRQPITLTAVRHTFSAYVQKYVPTYFDWAVLRVNSIANTATWFHITDCTLGTIGSAVVEAHVENLGDADTGDPWCRVSITYVGTAAAHDHDIILAESDGDIDFANPSNGNALSVWGAQVENTQLLTAPTSYIVTTTGSETRDVDDLRYTLSLSAPYTLECQGMLRPNSVTTGGGHALMVARTSGSQYVAIYAAQNQSSRAVVENDPAVGGGDAAITADVGDLTDGERHTTRAVFAATNNIRLYFDGAATGTDDVSNIPAGIARVDIGFWPDFGVYSANGIIGRCRVWSREVLP